MTSLLRLLNRNIRHCASDPRDQVYALLGLAYDGGASELDPRYGQTIPLDSYLRLSPNSRIRPAAAKSLKVSRLSQASSSIQKTQDSGKECTHGSRRRSLLPANARQCWKERVWRKSTRTLVANQGADSELVAFSLDSYRAFKTCISLAAETARDPQLSIATRPFFAAFAFVATNRKYCLTNKGSVGLVPADAQYGDQVCIFLGHRHALCHLECSGLGGLLLFGWRVLHRWAHERTSSTS